MSALDREKKIQTKKLKLVFRDASLEHIAAIILKRVKKTSEFDMLKIKCIINISAISTNCMIISKILQVILTFYYTPTQIALCK